MRSIKKVKITKQYQASQLAISFGSAAQLIELGMPDQPPLAKSPVSRVINRAEAPISESAPTPNSSDDESTCTSQQYPMYLPNQAQLFYQVMYPTQDVERFTYGNTAIHLREGVETIGSVVNNSCTEIRCHGIYISGTDRQTDRQNIKRGI